MQHISDPHSTVDYGLRRCCCYACRAKNITNKPRVNEDPKDAMLREFQDEIMRLKAALAVRHC
jgi:hypothetical protein